MASPWPCFIRGDGMTEEKYEEQDATTPVAPPAHVTEDGKELTLGELHTAIIEAEEARNRGK